jgi:hypothetical protein
MNTGIPIVEDHEAFVDHVRTHSADIVWLAYTLTEVCAILKLVNEFRNDLANIRLMPDTRTLEPFKGGPTNLLGEPTINLLTTVTERAAAKGNLQCFAVGALLVTWPLLIPIASAVKLNSPGPVFFKQRRRDADGRVFSIYKFRSMYLHDQNAGAPEQAKRGDSRGTRVGAFLHRISFDKLMQFFNVLVGNMSVVRHVRTHWSMTTRIRGSSRDVSIATGSSQAFPSGPRSMASAAKQTASRKWRDASHTIFTTSELVVRT